MFGLGLPEVIIISIPPVWALYDMSKSALSMPNKLIWALVVIAIPLFGAAAYFGFGRQKKVGGK